MKWPREVPALIKKSHFLRLNEIFIIIDFLKNLHTLERDSSKITSIRGKIIHVYLNNFMNKFRKGTQKCTMKSSKGITKT